MGKRVAIRLAKYDNHVAKLKVSSMNQGSNIVLFIESLLKGSEKILEVEETRPSLEEVFLYYSGELMDE